MVVIGVLLAPNISYVPHFSPKKSTSISISMVEVALDTFLGDNGIYPSDEEGLDALLKNVNREKYIYYNGPYLPKYIRDGWGEDFIYLNKGKTFMILSYGADKKEGGEGDNEDILFVKGND